MYACNEVCHLLSDSLDRKLRFRKRLEVCLHLLGCRSCSHVRKQMLFLREAARNYWVAVENKGTGPARGLSPEGRDRIQRSLKPGPT